MTGGAVSIAFRSLTLHGLPTLPADAQCGGYLRIRLQRHREAFTLFLPSPES
jgi:hypothetical protein